VKTRWRTAALQNLNQAYVGCGSFASKTVRTAGCLCPQFPKSGHEFSVFGRTLHLIAVFSTGGIGRYWTIRAELHRSARAISDVNLFSDGKCVVDLDTEVPHRTLNLRVAEQKLHGAQVAGPAIDQRCLGSPERVRTKNMRIQPDATIHTETKRAYCLVVMPSPGRRRLVNKNSPGFLPATFK
jgi:hypothetical protein